MGYARLELLGLVILLQLVLSFALRREEAIAYLQKYGYLHIPLSAKPPDYRLEELSGAIRTFQKATNLPSSGRLDKATVRMMDRPRCGLEDSSGGGLTYRVLGEAAPVLLLPIITAELRLNLCNGFVEAP
uniref:Peptidoglycan binding-like domain-containing protein n=1 Tax=Knipowitschia caucasica TaxID=637954 RepID=A0AAV2LZE5_KNICA